MIKELKVVHGIDPTQTRRPKEKEMNLPLIVLPIATVLQKPVEVSFEFFPPKTERMVKTLWSCIHRLEPLSPHFVSVTYGAGGNTRQRTHDTVVRIARETSLKPAAHLTCVGSSRAEIDDIAHRYWEAGIYHIVALRGDPSDGQNSYVPRADGYAHAVDLIHGLKKVANFEITVAAYPEVHPEAPNAAFDLDNLKRKVDAGASRAITQYFFDVNIYRRFMDKVQAAGITIPVVPGILPVTNVAMMLKFSQVCGATVPAWVHSLFDRLDADSSTCKVVAAVLALEQCRALAADGVTWFHFYTLNQADLVFAICHILGVKRRETSDSVAPVTR